MKGKIIVFRIDSKEGNNAASKLCRQLYGYTDKSNYGRYVYHRKGLLDRIAYKKLIRGVFIVRDKNADDFVSILKKVNAENYVREISLTPQDKKDLS